MGARGIVLAAGVSGEAADVPFLMDYLQTGLPMLCVGDSALSLCQTLGGALSEPVPQDGAMQIHLYLLPALPIPRRMLSGAGWGRGVGYKILGRCIATVVPFCGTESI